MHRLEPVHALITERSIEALALAVIGQFAHSAETSPCLVVIGHRTGIVRIETGRETSFWCEVHISRLTGDHMTIDTYAKNIALLWCLAYAIA